MPIQLWRYSVRWYNEVRKWALRPFIKNAVNDTGTDVRINAQSHKDTIIEKQKKTTVSTIRFGMPQFEIDIDILK